MATTKAPSAKTPEANGQDLAGEMDKFRKLLDVIDPPKNVEIVDIFGKIHSVSGVVSARSQIKIYREFEKVRELPVAEGAFANLGGGVTAGLLALAANPEVLSGLGRSFEIAFPIVFREVKAKAEAEGLEVEDASDLFPIEEVVSALVPLFYRLVRRGMSVATVLDQADGMSGSTSPN